MSGFVRFHVRILSAAILAAVLIPTTAIAQNAQQARCSTPEYRQFDFWAGDWVVHNAAGKLAGTNTITPMLNGCVLHEQWEGAGRGWTRAVCCSYSTAAWRTVRWSCEESSKAGTVLCGSNASPGRRTRTVAYASTGKILRTESPGIQRLMASIGRSLIPIDAESKVEAMVQCGSDLRTGPRL